MFFWVIVDDIMLTALCYCVIQLG